MEDAFTKANALAIPGGAAIPILSRWPHRIRGSMLLGALFFSLVCEAYRLGYLRSYLAMWRD